MDESRTEESRESQETDLRSGAESDIQAIAGVEVNLGDFSRTQSLLKSLRLTLNNQIVVAVEDIAGSVSEAGRKFKMGDLE